MRFPVKIAAQRCGFSALAFVLLMIASVSGCLDSQAQPSQSSGLQLSQGEVTLHSGGFSLVLVRSSQTVAALHPDAAPQFDFTPGDQLRVRAKNGFYHLGDLDLRLRMEGAATWQDYSTALERHPVTPLSTGGNILASADLAPTLPAGVPLRIVRTWSIGNGRLTLRFRLTNKTNRRVEVGALGIAMVFNNILTGRSLSEAHEKCVFYDPYIGEQAGYIQVTRLNGQGPALLVIPDRETQFEAYKPILNSRPGAPPKIFLDPTPRGITFEGSYDWMVFSKAFAENEWKRAQPWNPPTSVMLAPGESRSFGVRFVLAPSIRQIEPTLVANDRPVAIGIPGYVLPQDLDAKLFLSYPGAVKSIAVEPQGAITLHREHDAPNGWKTYRLRGRQWGRCRVRIRYGDGLVQTVHYFVTQPERQAVAGLGRFSTTRQWFVDPADPFHRSPSVMTYDRQANRIVSQESRVWIAGLSDEAGAGSWLAAFMKELGQPDPMELAKLQQFAENVLWGRLQYSSGPYKYGVRKSLFYYQPQDFPAGFYRSDQNWTSWTSWSKKASEAVDRSFNYPHVAAAWWVLYRLSRDHQGLVTDHPWSWYLDQAYETAMAMEKYAPYYSQFGQMEGDVFVEILADLKREGMTTSADRLESTMRARAAHWNTEAYPFGSEMPWDSTGQEEVFSWTEHFGYEQKAQVTLDAILGYMPTVPNWGYNGSARRYWDFLYGGKYPRIERQLHHYGSGINAIPVLSAYRKHPDDLYLLRIGYGGVMGPLTNLDQDGASSVAFHAFPDMLAFDPYSGDYGPNFFGFAWNTATYVEHDRNLGWLAFGGNLKRHADQTRIQPLDAFRSRIYLAPLGLWLTLDAGEFEEAVLNASAGTVELRLAPMDSHTNAALLRIEQPAPPGEARPYAPSRSLAQRSGAYIIPLKRTPVRLMLKPR